MKHVKSFGPIYDPTTGQSIMLYSGRARHVLPATGQPVPDDWHYDPEESDPAETMIEMHCIGIRIEPQGVACSVPAKNDCNVNDLDGIVKDFEDILRGFWRDAAAPKWESVSKTAAPGPPPSYQLVARALKAFIDASSLDSWTVRDGEDSKSSQYFSFEYGSYLMETIEKRLSERISEFEQAPA